MRTVTFNAKTITYPDRLVFAYNPNPIVVTGSNIETFVINGAGKAYTDTREAYNGKVSIDVSRYLQMFVSEKVIGTEVTVEVAGQTLDFLVLWGAINIGEKFNASRRLTWYRNLPFTVSMYIPEGGAVSKRYEGTTYEAASIDTGLQEINPQTLFTENKTAYIRMLGGALVGVFEYTFDYTFLNIDDNSFIIELLPSDCTDGIYLRWIDRHGFRQYRLFKRGVVSDKSKEEGEELETDYTDEMPRYGVKVYQSKTMERSVSIGAPSCDEEEYCRLRTLDSSAWVEMYVNGKWIPIRVKSATVKDESKDLQDYEAEILLPDIISQSL